MSICPENNPNHGRFSIENLPDFKWEPFRLVLQSPILPSTDEIGTPSMVEFFPVEAFSIDLPSYFPSDIKPPVIELAAKDLVTTMVNYLKDSSTWDKALAVFLQKEIIPDQLRITLYVVAYEIRGFDVRHNLALKDVKGLLFVWLYGGILAWEHLR